MCGFVGLRHRGEHLALLQERLDSAISSLRHRGPDGEGRFITSWLHLGHTRLSIIDLTDAAQQPMVDHSGRYVLVFNGEIYNYRELAGHYLSSDDTFNRNSDTSVLLALFRRLGRGCLKHLDGMFAFAVVDLVERSVFLARDRFGEKPLYFVQSNGSLAFASEISALRRIQPNIKWEIDEVSLALYHIVGSIPAPRTIYKDVQSLPPAHWREVDAEGNVRGGTFWSLEQAVLDHDNALSLSPAEALAKCRVYLSQAARSRMVADVPVGIFLSGGLDSSSLLSTLATQGHAELDALCIDFPNSDLSEYRFAEASASTFGARLHRSVVTPEMFIEHLAGFFNSADQPTTDGFNTYFVAMCGRQLGIKVWLSGVGGDELFGGYPSFQRIGRLARLARVLQMVLPKSFAATWVRNFPQQLRISRALHMAANGDPVKRAYQVLRNPIPVDNALLSQSNQCDTPRDLLQNLLDDLYPNTGYCRDSFQRASAMETSVYMGSQLLRDIDNFSMAHSIETRAPFLDHKLFEFVFALPARLKTGPGQKKPLLTGAAPKPLPRVVLEQPKRGFTFPLADWLKTFMSSSFREYVLTDANSAFWDIAVLERMWDGYTAGRVHWGVLWSYYSFARWKQAHCE